MESYLGCRISGVRWDNIGDCSTHLVSIQAPSNIPAIFNGFPQLPTEIRVRIWKYAMEDLPCIVELEELPEHFRLYSGSSSYGFIDRSWGYRNINPPSLLRACRESRTAALKAYTSNGSDNLSAVAGPQWIRFDVDIVHIKSLWSGTTEGGFSCFHVSRPQELVCKARPEFFGLIKRLALNREVFNHISTAASYVCVIRHCFPNLEELIVLIDDEINIEEAWGPHDGVDPNDTFLRYEDEPGNFPGILLTRDAFVAGSTGPFLPVSKKNRGYELWLLKRMGQVFQNSKNYFRDYNPPKVTIMGCFLPKGFRTMECGRWPKGYKMGS